MKRGKKAQSQIITTVLLILLVLAAIVIVWQIVQRTIKSSSESIYIPTINLDIEHAYLNEHTSPYQLEITVKRLSGKGEISSLKFILIDEKENNYIYEYAKQDNLPGELETYTYIIPAGNENINPPYTDFLDPEAEIKKVKLAYLGKTTSGKNVTIPLSIITISGGVSPSPGQIVAPVCPTGYEWVNNGCYILREKELSVLNKATAVFYVATNVYGKDQYNTVCGYYSASNTIHRFWVNFDISQIPDNAIIEQVHYKGTITSVNTGVNGIKINNMLIQNPLPGSVSAQQIYEDAGDGFYTSCDEDCTTTGDKEIDLEEKAVEDLQNKLSEDWFGIAVQNKDEPTSGNTYIIAFDLLKHSLKVSYWEPYPG